jgi:hypothetical protein
MMFWEISFSAVSDKKITKKFETREKAESYITNLMKHVSVKGITIQKIH